MKKSVLIIGSGHKYDGANRCFPNDFDVGLLESADITLLDNDLSVNPDVVADVTKDGWWNVFDSKFDIIVDSIGHLGPHITDQPYWSVYGMGMKEEQKSKPTYKPIFKTGCRELTTSSSKIYGHAEI